jgi:hypothetical protein
MTRFRWWLAEKLAGVKPGQQLMVYLGNTPEGRRQRAAAARPDFSIPDSYAEAIERLRSEQK